MDKQLFQSVLERLLKANEPWVVYRSMKDLQRLSDSDPLVQNAKEKLLKHPNVQQLLSEIGEWPGVVLNSHKSAGQLYHKLAFAAELGLGVEEIPVREALERMKNHRLDEGIFRLPMSISTGHGGTGERTWAWALCDAPLQHYTAVLLGLKDDDSNTGIEHLKNLIRENGWPCAVSKELGKFRGPGRKDDPCPYATLIMLKLLTVTEGGLSCAEAKIGTEVLLSLWTESTTQHPYMFYMGKDFRKLKAPFIWYDILHVVEVLSYCEWVYEDVRFIEMMNLVRSKVNAEGFYTPESEWTAWKNWDFGQKKNPSNWLTFLVWRIEQRIEGRIEPPSNWR